MNLIIKQLKIFRNFIGDKLAKKYFSVTVNGIWKILFVNNEIVAA